jgi:hypothetical protein
VAETVFQVNSRADLAGNDVIDWGQLPPSITILGTPESVVSNGGLNAVVTSPSGQVFSDQQGNPWKGNFAPGDNLIGSGQFFTTAPIFITFASPVLGVGAQIETDGIFPPAFLGSMIVFDALGNVLGSFTTPGIATSDADNSAVFIGAAEASGSVPDISTVEFFTSSSFGFAINALSLIVPPQLFTTGSDTVDFNHLTAAQKALITSGADLLQGLGGNDTVILPNVANYDQVVGTDQSGNSVTLNWPSLANFRAGDTTGQIYKITGGDGDNHIILGDGNDVVYGSPGNDFITTGSGQVTFNYQEGEFANFSGFQGGASQLLLGHSSFQTLASGKQDVIKLPGSPNNYQLTTAFTADSFLQTQTTIASQEPLPPSIQLTTSQIEHVTFASPVTNVVQLFGHTIAAEMLELASEVYGDLPTLGHTAEPLAYMAGYSPGTSTLQPQSRNWHPVNAMELGLQPADFNQDADLQYSFVNGFYAAYQTSDQFLGDKPEANAFVLTGVVNGKVTLAISFRGTDQYTDFHDYTNFSKYYAKFAPLIDAIQAYVGDPANGIQQILVSGHSLGGGIVPYFMAQFPNAAYDVLAFTDGMPGTDVGAPPDNRIITFNHPDDPVAGLAGTASALAPALGLAVSVIAVDAAPFAGPAGGAVVGLNGAGSDVEGILNNMSPKVNLGTIITIDDIFAGKGWVTDYTLDAHNNKLYASDLALISQYALDSTSPFAATPLAQSLKNGTVYAGGPMEFGLAHNGTVAVNPADNYVLGDGQNDKITLNANDFQKGISAFNGLAVNIDGGTGNNSLVVTETGGYGDFGTPIPDGTGGYFLPYVSPALQIVGEVIEIDPAHTQTVNIADIHRVNIIFNLGVNGNGQHNGVTSSFKEFKLDGSQPNVQTPSSPSGAQAMASGAQAALPQLVVDHSYDYTDAGDQSLNIIGSGQRDIIALGAGNDTVTETTGDNIIFVKSAVNAGNLVINAGSGNNYIVTGDGTNTITGGAGNNTFVLLGGTNTVTGGSGMETFVIGGGVTEITDFSSQDAIAVNNPNAVILTETITNTQTTLLIDTNGSGQIGATVILDHVTGSLVKEASSTASNFLLSTATSAGAGGYLSGATVFADTNGNGVLDGNESSAPTDANGSFILSATSSGPLVATGGTDIATGLVFTGQLSAPNGSSVITPLTTVVNAVQNAGITDVTKAQQAVLSALGLNTSISLTGVNPVVLTLRGDNLYSAEFVADIKVLDTASLIAATLSGIGGNVTTIFYDTMSALGTIIKGLSSGQLYSLDDTTTITALINAGANAAGINISAGAAAGLSTAIVASNAALDQVLQADHSGLPLFTDASAIELVALGKESTGFQGDAGNSTNITQTVTSYTGGNLTTAISTAKAQLAPLPTMVSMSALTDNSSTKVNAGHVVTVTLNLSEAVTVTGVPTLQLNDDEAATYVSGSGSAHLVFAYTVQSFDSTPDLSVVGLNLPLGATIQDTNGVNLLGNVSGGLGIEVDASTLAITSIRATTDNGSSVLAAGHVVTITIDTSDQVTVTGTPTLQLNDNEVASYIGGSGTGALTFQYTVQPNDAVNDLQVTGFNLPTGATIHDASGNSLSGNVLGDLGLLVTIPPAINSLSAATDNHAAVVNAGHVVTITMTTSEAVTVTGTPTLQLNDNEVAAYTFGSGTSTLSFSYVAQTGDNVADLHVTGLNLPTGASILDGNGNSLAGSVTSDLGIQVDTVTVPLTSVQQQILGLYGVLYTRAADFGGLSYWTGVVGQQPDGAGVTVANGASTAITINDATVLGQLFVSTESSYFNQVYGSMSDSAFITTLYGTIGGNTIGIAPGITYWSGVLQALETAGQSQQAARAGIVGEIVQAMIDYNINIRPAGYTDAEWLAAQQRQETTDNKVAVSLAYSNASQQPGGTILDAVTVTDAAFLAATRVIEGVTYNGTTADAAISNILHAVALQDLTQIQPIGVVSGGLMG